MNFPLEEFERTHAYLTGPSSIGLPKKAWKGAMKYVQKKLLQPKYNKDIYQIHIIIFQRLYFISFKWIYSRIITVMLQWLKIGDVNWMNNIAAIILKPDKHNMCMVNTYR